MNTLLKAKKNKLIASVLAFALVLGAGYFGYGAYQTYALKASIKDYGYSFDSHIKTKATEDARLVAEAKAKAEEKLD